MLDHYEIKPLPSPYPRGTDIVPFTTTWGAGIAGLFEQMRYWLDHTLVPYINNNFEGIIEADKAIHAELIAQVNAIAAGIAGQVDDAEAAKAAAEAARDLAAQYASAVVAVQDGALAALFENAASEIRAIADELYTDRTVIDATKYGVKSDGVTNDTVALQNLLNSVAGKSTSTVKLPPGETVVSSISIPRNVSLIGSGKGVTVIAQAGTIAPWLITAQGSIQNGLTYLTEAVLPGASILTVLSAANLAPGDLIVLHDSVSYTTTDAGYKSGEMLRVEQVVSSTSIKVMGTIRGSWGTTDGAYTPGNTARISKVTPIDGVTVADLSLKGDISVPTSMLMIQYARKATVRDVDIIQSGAAGVRFDGCFMSTALNVSGTDLIDNLAGGQAGYGIVVSGPSEKVTVHGGIISRARHAFTTMGGQYGMPHNLHVEGMNVSECSVSGIDTHAAGEDVTIIGNNVTRCAGGITFRTRKTSVLSNRVRNSTSHGIGGTETNLKDVAIIGNDIEGTSGHGISIGGTADGVKIVGNNVGETGADGISVTASSTDVAIANNVIKNVGVLLTERSHVRSGQPAAGLVAATTGWYVNYNTCIQEPTSVVARRAIDILASGLTGAYAAFNTAAGAFSAPPFNVEPKFGMFNRRQGEPAPSIGGSRGGNVALSSLLKRLALDGYIADDTVA